MSTRIRLKRIGKKKKPFYRIIVADSRSPRNGKFIESIGYYDPLKEPIDLKINEEKAVTWLKKGASPSDTVKSLFRMKGIILRYDLTKKGFSEEKINEEFQKHQILQEEKLKKKSLLRDLKKEAAEKKKDKQAETKAEEKEEKKEEKK